MKLEKYSFGIGDRFGVEGAAQLRPFQRASEAGVEIVPVWNKSNREHTIIGTVPGDTRREADEAVSACNWGASYYVDADHIGLVTVERFLDSSDFFTIDVADSIGKPADPESRTKFLDSMKRFKGKLWIPGVEQPFEVTDDLLNSIASKYLQAMKEAGEVCRKIAAAKGDSGFISEVSVDEAGRPQTPAELFFILGAVAGEGIPIQTIAPKFTGAFLKGVDYVGEVAQFAREFADDIAVVAHAVEVFGLPANLKLSVHSGSDKFSLYPHIGRILKNTGGGIHVKTAGTTWLEELIGLAEAGGEGLKIAQEVYAEAFKRYDELVKPYATVVHIDRSHLPNPSEVGSWTSAQYVTALRHDQSCAAFNSNFRQLVHVGYKVASDMGERFRRLLSECRKEIEANVTLNLYERHIRPIFLEQNGKAGQTADGKTAAMSKAQ